MASREKIEAEIALSAGLLLRLKTREPLYAGWLQLFQRGILPIIPPRSKRKTPVHPDYRRYKDRNRVERMFGKLKQQRRIATRYDKTVLSFESFLNLAAARLWLKSFVNAA